MGYTEINNVHILDLAQSARLLKETDNYIKLALKKNKTFLFVATKPQITSLIASEAKRCNSHYVNERWLGGMLTNWITLKSRIERLKSLEKQEKAHVFSLFQKKKKKKKKK